MRPLISHIPLTACALATALLVSACGGGDASAPPTVIGTSGLAVDDYISGATVVCDTNGNGASDTGEATTTTDSTGFFKFAAVCASGLVVTGGTNIDTNLPFVGKLKAPAGSTLVTPLTTLLTEGMTQDQINTALGLPAGTNVTTLDPARKVAGELVNADLFRKTLVVQQVLQKTAEALAALANSNDVAAMYSQATAAMASVLRTPAAASLVAGGVVNEASVSAVIKAAAMRVEAGVNADSLAQVMASALAAQSKIILDATDAQSISDATKAQQGSATIQSFVIANKSVLEGVPGDATAALKNQLVEQVGSGTVTPPPPPPPASGTVLLSFDEANPVFVDMGAFGDGSPSVAAAPTGGSGNALKLDRSGGSNFGGTYFNVPVIPFTADRKTITARVYATRANAVVYLKVEVAGGVSTELPATVTAANTWQALTWNLSGVHPANSYNVMVFSADTDVANVGAQSYWVDDIVLAPASDVVAPPPPPPANTTCDTSTEQCISFSEANAGANPFEKLVSAEVMTDPADSNNKLLKMVKGPSSELWAGATVFTALATDGDKTIRTVPTVGLGVNKSVTVRVNSGAVVGTKVTLKLENALGAGSVYAEARTTQQNAWETLTFNFASPSAGTFNANVSYDMASLFPAWSEIEKSQPALTADTTFYFDELKYAISVATPPPPAQSCAAPACVDFSGSGIGFGPFENPAGTVEMGVDPLDAGNKVVKFVKKPADPDYFGTTITGLGVNPVLTDNARTVTMRVFSPAVGTNFLLKFEGGTGGNAAVTEKDVATTVAGAWETLTFVMPNTGTFTTVVVFPHGRSKVASDTTMYIDDLQFPATAGGSGGSGGGTPGAMVDLPGGVFAANYVGNTIETWKSTAGGDVGIYVDESVTAPLWWSGLAAGDATPSVYFGYGVNTNQKPWGFGVFVKAPNNGAANVGAYTNLKLAVWGNDQLVNKNPRPNFTAVLNAPAIGSCIPAIKSDFQVAGAGVQNYVLPLAGFSLLQACGLANVAAVLATGVTQVNVQVLGDNLQYNAGGDAAGLYPNGLNMGPIAFN